MMVKILMLILMMTPEPPTNYLNINDNSDGEKNDYEVTPDTSISGRNN